jgi:tetratricopeptide (TPR) repeat protein
MQRLPTTASRSDDALPHASSLNRPARWPIWLPILCGLVAFSPLLEGGTTHQAVMIIRLLILVLLGIHAMETIGKGAMSIGSLRVALPVLGYLGLAALSTWRSPYPNQSLQWLMVLLGYAILLYVLVSVLDQWKHVTILLVTVAGVGLLEAGWALVQGGWLGAIRPTGSFFNPNFLAGYLAACATLVLGWLLYVPAPSERGAWIGGHWVRLGWLIAILATVLSALIWTGSRGGLLALSAGTLVVIGLRFGRRWAGGLLLTLLLLGVLIPNPLRDRFRSEHAVNPETYARWQLWQSAVRESAAHPLGIGLGLYQYVYPRHAVPIEGQIARYGKVAQTPHNEYLQMGVELGPAGLLLFCWGIAVAAREAMIVLKLHVSRWQRGTAVGVIAAAAVILVHAAVDSNLHEPALAILLTLFLAIILSMRRMAGGAGVPETTIPLRFRILWAGATMILLAAMAVPVVKVGLAWMAYERGAEALRQQNLNEAVNEYEAATRLDPGKALYHSSLAAAHFQIFQRTSEEQAGQAAVEELRRAIALNPLDGRLCSLLGHVYVSLASAAGQDAGRKAERLQSALSSYARAQELEPYTAFHRFEQGRIRLALGQREQAEAAVREAVEMEPNFLPGREWLARLYLSSGQVDAADREYREILERQRRYVDWVKDPLARRFLEADASSLQAALERRKART